MKRPLYHSILIIDFYLSLGPVFVSVVVEHVEYNGVLVKEIKREKKDLWAPGGYFGQHSWNTRDYSHIY